MKTILALATTVLLFAPGCGDTSSTTDMTVTVQDMAMSTVGMDMTAKTCSAIQTCAAGCFTQAGQTNPLGCALQCAQGVTGTAASNFQKLATCLETNCALDASVSDLKTCAETKLATPDAMGGCKDEATTCAGT